MSDRAAKRTFTLGSLNVDVDPLLIAGAGCKCVDARLIDSDPVRHAKFLADVFIHVSNCELAHARLLPTFLGQSTDLDRTANSYTLLYFSRSSFLLILPTLVLPSSSTNRILSGMPNFEITPLSTKTFKCALISASVTPLALLGSLTTNAIGRSPQRSSFTPITAASATPEHCVIRSSICNDDTHSPPVLITSLMRSVI